MGRPRRVTDALDLGRFAYGPGQVRLRAGAAASPGVPLGPGRLGSSLGVPSPYRACTPTPAARGPGWACRPVGRGLWACRLGPSGLL
jgi:hypothetical protein